MAGPFCEESGKRAHQGTQDTLGGACSAMLHTLDIVAPVPQHDAIPAKHAAASGMSITRHLLAVTTGSSLGLRATRGGLVYTAGCNVSLTCNRSC